MRAHGKQPLVGPYRNGGMPEEGFVGCFVDLLLLGRGQAHRGDVDGFENLQLHRRSGSAVGVVPIGRFFRAGRRCLACAGGRHWDGAAATDAGSCRTAATWARRVWDAGERGHHSRDGGGRRRMGLCELGSLALCRQASAGVHGNSVQLLWGRGSRGDRRLGRQRLGGGGLDRARDTVVACEGRPREYGGLGLGAGASPPSPKGRREACLAYRQQSACNLFCHLLLGDDAVFDLGQGSG